MSEVSNLGIFVQDGGRRAVVSSRDVARVFEKEHKNVLRDIQNLSCSKSFTELNFELSTYEDATGRELPQYLMTRDGFVILAMGFTGEKAMQFKEAYIAAFNAMEKALLEEEFLAAIDDLVNRFVDERCMAMAGARLSRADFYLCFSEWCAVHGYTCPSRCAAVRSMNRLRRFRMGRSNEMRYWEGVRCA